MILTQHELQDPVWLKLKAHLEDRLFDLRKQNDADLTQDQTVKLRGRIAEVKKILSLGMTAEIIED